MPNAAEQPTWLPNLPTRPVRCHHCARLFDVAPRAISASCPGCYKRIVVENIVLKGSRWGVRILTCGHAHIHRRAHYEHADIIAGAGVTIDGLLEGDVVTGGLVRLTDRASVKGRIRAPRIDIHPGVILDDVRLEISPTPLEALAPIHDLISAA